MTSIVLPVSGKAATFRRLTGRDSLEAERQCSDPNSVIERQFAVLARCTLLDGVQATLHEIVEMDAEDIVALNRASDVFMSASRPPKH